MIFRHVITRHKANGHRPKTLLAIFVAFVASTLPDTSHALDLELRGFADIVAERTNTFYPLNTLRNDGKHLTIDPESRLGLNLSAVLGNDVTFAGQLVGRGSTAGSYNLAADWLFATYRPLERLAIRVGRQISPVFLYSEQIDVGFTYLWARLPYELYGIYPLKSLNGLAFSYTYSLGDYQLKGAVLGGGGDSTIEAAGVEIKSHAHDQKQFELALTSDHLKIHGSYIITTSGVTGTASVPIAPGVTGTAQFPIALGKIQIAAAGVSYEDKNWSLLTETARFTTDETFVKSLSGAYASVGFHIDSKLTPYVMYAWQWGVNGTAFVFPDPTIQTLRTKQHSTMIGLNFKMTPSVALKAEYMKTQIDFADSSHNIAADTLSSSVDLIF
jgi:hypothetical protein